MSQLFQNLDTIPLQVVAAQEGEEGREVAFAGKFIQVHVHMGWQMHCVLSFPCPSLGQASDMVPNICCIISCFTSIIISVQAFHYMMVNELRSTGSCTFPFRFFVQRTSGQYHEIQLGRGNGKLVRFYHLPPHGLIRVPQDSQLSG